jgi:uncharacterized protein (DUF779 family)
MAVSCRSLVVSAESNRPAPGLKPGAIAGSPFYVDAELYERWGSPRFVLDVGEGEAGGFSQSGGRTLARRARPAKRRDLDRVVATNRDPCGLRMNSGGS